MERPQRSEDERRGQRQGPAHANALSEETPAFGEQKGTVNPLPNYQRAVTPWSRRRADPMPYRLWRTPGLRRR